MEDNIRKEELSISYLNTLCAYKGISFEIQKRDDDSMDVMLKKKVVRSDGNKYHARLGVQLKATSSDMIEHDTFYSFPLKKKNFDDLRTPGTMKTLLFLLILPPNESDWITHSIEQLIIRKCMFWMDLDDCSESDNKSNVTLQIPKINIVSSEFLDEVLRKIAEEDMA